MATITGLATAVPHLDFEQDYRRLWQLGSFYPVSGFIPKRQLSSGRLAALVSAH